MNIPLLSPAERTSGRMGPQVRTRHDAPCDNAAFDAAVADYEQRARQIGGLKSKPEARVGDGIPTQAVVEAVGVSLPPTSGRPTDVRMPCEIEAVAAPIRQTPEAELALDLLDAPEAMDPNAEPAMLWSDTIVPVQAQQPANLMPSMISVDYQLPPTGLSAVPPDRMPSGRPLADDGGIDGNRTTSVVTGGTEQYRTEAAQRSNSGKAIGDYAFPTAVDDSATIMSVPSLRQLGVQHVALETHMRFADGGRQRAGSSLEALLVEAELATGGRPAERAGSTVMEPILAVGSVTDKVQAPEPAFSPSLEVAIADEGSPQQQIAQFVSGLVDQSAETSGAASMPRAGGAGNAARLQNDTQEVVKAMRFVLRPAELGQVDVRMTIDGGNVRLHLRFEREESAVIVRSNKHELEQALASTGLSVDGITIVGDRANAGAPTPVSGGPVEWMLGSGGREAGTRSGSERQHGRSSGSWSSAAPDAEPREVDAVDDGAKTRKLSVFV
jgi:hypothetical protein